MAKKKNRFMLNMQSFILRVLCVCAFGYDEHGPTIGKCGGAFLMRGRRNGSVNYYYFHAHQCSLLLTDTRLCSALFIIQLEMEGNIERCAA